MAGPLPDNSDVLSALGIGQPGVPPLPPGNPGGSAPVQSSAPVVSGSSGGGGVSATIANQQRAITNGQAQMASDFSQIGQISNAIVAATKASGTDEGIIATQQAKGLLAAQTAARSVASSYGGNPDDVSFIMNKLGADWEQAEAQRQQQLNVVQQKQSVSFSDNPIQWFINKLSINTDIAQYNDDEERANTLYQQLTRINSLNTQTADSMKAIAQTQTAATVQATSDMAAQKTAIAAGQAQIQGLIYNAKGIQDVTQMGQDQVSNAVQGANVAIAYGHLELAQKQVAIMSEEQSERAALFAEDIKQKQQQDASDTAMLDAANRGRAVIGLPALPQAKIFALIKAGGQIGDQARSWIQTGLTNDAIGKAIIAPTAGTSARILAENNSPLHTVNPAVKPVTDLLQNSYNQARNPQSMAALGVNPKDVSTLDNAVSGLVNQQVTGMAANIKAGDNSNIYQAAPLTSLGSLPSVKSNPVWNTVLAPQVKAGMSETDPAKIIALTLSAVQNKQISLSDASTGIANLFQSAVALNTQTKDYMRFGIAPQATYNTMLDFTGTFGGSARVNLADRAQVATAMAKLMTSTQEAQAIRNVNNGLPPNATMWQQLYGGK